MKLFEGFLTTQPLWKQKQFGLKQFKLPQVNLSTFTPTPIPSKLRLGHQVERVFLQILENNPDYKVLAHSLQVKRDNITIGELDFLVSHKEQVYHIELSCKFYLIDPEITEAVHKLVGPNRADVFFAKLNKTKNKQLPLLYSKECLAQLQSLQIDPSKVIQQVCFLAQLFAPISNTSTSINPLNKQCIKGVWMRMQDFKREYFNKSVYYFPYKSQWIEEPHNNVAWIPHYNVLLEINTLHSNKKSPMLWRKLPDGSLDKFFVVWW